MKFIVYLTLSLLIGLGVWFIPEPAGVHPHGWELFAVFTATIAAVILKILPMGVIAITSLTVLVAFRILTFQEAFSGFGNEIVWLVVSAFFIARGFLSTNLGMRISYIVMKALGKNCLGLGYGLVATDLLLAPAIPSVTARAGGIVYPLTKALNSIFSGKSHDPRMGGFLVLTAFQGSVITSAMFLTAMAGNPLIIELARGQGAEISWGSWLLAACVPGIASLILVPFILYKLISPTIRQTPHAKEMAVERLQELGPMEKNEWIMAGTFILLILFWIIGPYISIRPTLVALFGVLILLFSGVLKWRDVIEETGAWDTFVWFSTFITLTAFLNQFGIANWFSHWVADKFYGFNWITGSLLISLIYFYTHYFFVSSVAHIGVMYAPFLIVMIAIGTPVKLAALVLAFFSSLFGGLTQYSSGPAPIFFGSGFVSVSSWWKIGFLVSLVNIAVWLGIGSVWWKLLGFW
jgi:DASS family divalent anion:Na+ symporter